MDTKGPDPRRQGVTVGAERGASSRRNVGIGEQRETPNVWSLSSRLTEDFYERFGGSIETKYPNSRDRKEGVLVNNVTTERVQYGT